MLLFLKQFIASSLIVIMLSGCVVVPTFSDGAEEPVLCDVFSRSIKLKYARMNNAQISMAILVGAGLLPYSGLLGAASFLSSTVISSSIYVVGNTAHYLEKSVRCDDESILQDRITKFSEKMVAAGGKKIELEALKKVQTQKEIDQQQKIMTLELENEEIAAKLEKIQAELDELEAEREELKSELKDLNL